MLTKSGAGTSRLRSIPIGLGLLACIWSADSAFAAQDTQPTTSLGSVSVDLTTDTGDPTNPGGGGPFELTFSGVTSPTNLLSSLGIPSSVQSWCIDLSDSISPGQLNSGVNLYYHGASELGGMIAAGLKFLNVVNTGGTGGTANLTGAGATEFAAYTNEGSPTVFDWSAQEIAATVSGRDLVASGPKFASHRHLLT